MAGVLATTPVTTINYRRGKKLKCNFGLKLRFLTFFDRITQPSIEVTATKKVLKRLEEGKHVKERERGRGRCLAQRSLTLIAAYVDKFLL